MVDWGAQLVQVVLQQASGCSGELIFTLAISKRTLATKRGGGAGGLHCEQNWSTAQQNCLEPFKTGLRAVIPTQMLLFSVTSRGFINLLNDNVNTTKKESLYGENEEAGVDINRDKIA